MGGQNTWGQNTGGCKGEVIQPAKDDAGSDGSAQGMHIDAETAGKSKGDAQVLQTTMREHATALSGGGTTPLG
jgi:hypothetical protein